MNNTPIRTPSLNEFRNAGYSVNISHLRRYKVAYIPLHSSKLVVKTFFQPEHPRVDPKLVMTELLPKGGKTEVRVTDKETGAEFFGYSICHPKDNFKKSEGINEALKRVTGLMLVMDGTDGFKFRIQV